MSHEEKKMNRRDLKSFKAYDGKMEAMVIGINSTPEPRRNNAKLKTIDNDSTEASRAVSRSLIAHPLRNSIFNKQNP